VTPFERDLARHALGLDGRRTMSYRNRFVAGPSHDDHPAWLEMVRAGLAVRRDGAKLPFGGDDLFHLTPDGAHAALMPGETLDPEDFQ
jgi:hypothetical protein